ncbi:MAG: VWA domain-containing protein [Candidatus Omnitrophica bacterium]|nr:VWA domain-containing protein [Candidatus Omnitrophota bacterium]MBU1926103.1 VWA domain-containing protein [Candidatus Omnitrophota bacterium]MBU2063038.1 VWA domain-containing protein [Candidatus Omnitrophota bacterium]
MRFVNQAYNGLFLIVIALVFLYIFVHKKRKTLFGDFADMALHAKLAPGGINKQRKIKAALILCAVFFCVVALLRPQYGFHWEEVKHEGVNILIAVDVSKSMQTKDVLPSRLGRAKLAIQDLIAELGGDRVGLIAFAGTAFLQCPLTIDYDGFLLSVETLKTDIIPQGGTDIEAAINEAIKSFSQGAEGVERILIIITDGETHTGNALAAAERAKQNNIKIYTIGVGTKEGELISIADDYGNTAYLKDKDGRVVKSRLNEPLLQEIAVKSEGIYIKATPTQFGLAMLYETKISKLQKEELKSRMEKRFIERFQVPLTLVFILLFLESFIGTRTKYEVED